MGSCAARVHTRSRDAIGNAIAVLIHAVADLFCPEKDSRFSIVAVAPATLGRGKSVAVSIVKWVADPVCAPVLKTEITQRDAVRIVFANGWCGSASARVMTTEQVCGAEKIPRFVPALVDLTEILGARDAVVALCARVWRVARITRVVVAVTPRIPHIRVVRVLPLARMINRVVVCQRGVVGITAAVSSEREVAKPSERAAARSQSEHHQEVNFLHNASSLRYLDSNRRSASCQYDIM